jgi:hypothetical protein
MGRFDCIRTITVKIKMYNVPKIKKIYIYVDLPRHLENKTATKLKIPERNHQIIIHRLICITNRAI